MGATEFEGRSSSFGLGLGTICFRDREEVLGSTDILDQKQKQSHCDVGEPCVIGAELMH